MKIKLSYLLLLAALAFVPKGYAVDEPPAGSSIGAEEEAFRRPRPPLEPLESPLIEYEIEEVKPAKQDEATFQVNDITIEGETQLAPEVIDKFLNEYEGKELSLSQLKEAAELITRAIRSQGYVTSRVYVPAQKMGAGTVQLKVLEGKIGAIKIEGLKQFKESYVLRKMKTKPGEALLYSSLEQDLTRLNQHPDRKVTAVLAPGEVTGTTDLILNVEETFPVHVGYTIDNTGTRLTGQLRHGVSVSHTNLLGLDDIFQTRFLITDGGNFVAASADYFIPVSATTDVSVNYTFVDTRLGGAFNDLKIRGEAHSWSATVIQKVFENDRWDASFFAGIDFKEIGTTVNHDPSSRDNLRVLRFGPQVSERDSQGRTFLTTEFDFGFDTILGANDRIDVNSSRPEAGGQFFRTVIEAGRIQKLPKELYALLRVAAHLTPDKLPASEQMRAGGADTVRGYPEGDFLAERGILASAEIRAPSFFIPRDLTFPKSDFKIRDSIQLVGFVDMARLEAKGAPQNQPANQTMIGVGGGLRFNLSRRVLGRNTIFRIDWAYPVGQKPNTDNTKRLPRVHFSLSTSL